MRHIPLLIALVATSAMTLSACKPAEDDAARHSAAQQQDDAATSSTSSSASSSSTANTHNGVSFSLNTDGFSMDLDLPLDKLDMENAMADGEGLYPGSRVTGVNVDTNSENGKTRTIVSVGFTAPADKDTVAKWFVKNAPVKGGTAKPVGDKIIGRTGDGQDYVLTLSGNANSTNGQMKVAVQK